MATRVRTVHRCGECGVETPRWLGRCPGCSAWGSLVEQARVASPPNPGHSAERPVPLADVDPVGAAKRPTGSSELDRVLGGGLVAGSVTLLGGEPGIGKSTLLLQTLGHLAHSGARCLLVAAEESPEQVRVRAGRLGALEPGLLVVAETSLPHVLAHVESTRPDVLAVDSIQSLVDPDRPGSAGSVGQVRDCAHRLVREAKQRALATLIVGHVTKGGALAGPRVLEHLVDTVLSFEGERHQGLRLLRALKHRFGPTHELGLFEMAEQGVVDVPDASSHFLADRHEGVRGSVVAPVLDGARPVLVEVQALVAQAANAVPRRVAQGIDAARLAMILAVLEQRARLPVGRVDVFASVAGGVRVSETGVDLALALAIAGARLDVPVAPGAVALGEVGLGGELRRVPGTARRLGEAARLGFDRALVPPSTAPVAGIEVVVVADVAEALQA